MVQDKDGSPVRKKRIPWRKGVIPFLCDFTVFFVCAVFAAMIFGDWPMLVTLVDSSARNWGGYFDTHSFLGQPETRWFAMTACFVYAVGGACWATRLKSSLLKCIALAFAAPFLASPLTIIFSAYMQMLRTDFSALAALELLYKIPAVPFYVLGAFFWDTPTYWHCWIPVVAVMAWLLAKGLRAPRRSIVLPQSVGFFLIVMLCIYGLFWAGTGIVATTQAIHANRTLNMLEAADADGLDRLLREKKLDVDQIIRGVRWRWRAASLLSYVAEEKDPASIQVLLRHGVSLREEGTYAFQSLIDALRKKKLDNALCLLEAWGKVYPVPAENVAASSYFYDVSRGCEQASSKPGMCTALLNAFESAMPFTEKDRLEIRKDIKRYSSFFRVENEERLVFLAEKNLMAREDMLAMFPELVQFNPYVSVTEFLLAQGANPNMLVQAYKLDKEGVPVLLAALTYNSNREVATALLKAGADPNGRDKDGKTVLDLFDERSATLRYLPEYVEEMRAWLVRAGAKPGSEL